MVGGCESSRELGGVTVNENFIICYLILIFFILIIIKK